MTAATEAAPAAAAPATTKIEFAGNAVGLIVRGKTGPEKLISIFNSRWLA